MRKRLVRIFNSDTAFARMQGIVIGIMIVNLILYMKGYFG